ncbi:histidine kinase dimerization/phospho-acceptor domain-containing protein [Listeria aquatica]
MTDELAAVDAARQEFVANVSHELQSPLTSMHGFAELLAQDKLTEEERKSYWRFYHRKRRGFRG